MTPPYPSALPASATPPRVAFLGPQGSFTWLAAKSVFGEAATYVETPAHEVARMVQRREWPNGCDYGVLPEANIKHGFVESTYRALYDTSDIQIVGEVMLPVEFHLISSSSHLDEIHTVISHEVALSQCQSSLDRLSAALGRPLVRVPAASTSAAVKQARSLPGVASLGSLEAARLFDVPVLKSGMHDHPENVTRFWVFGLGNVPARTARSKTLFLVELGNEPENLMILIDLLTRNGVRITAVKQQVIPQKSRAAAWSYAHFVECEGHVSDAGLSTVYRALKRAEWKVLRNRSGRLLGSFPAFPAETLRFAAREPRARKHTVDEVVAAS